MPVPLPSGVPSYLAGGGSLGAFPWSVPLTTGPTVTLMHSLPYIEVRWLGARYPQAQYGLLAVTSSAWRSQGGSLLRYAVCLVECRFPGASSSSGQARHQSHQHRRADQRRPRDCQQYTRQYDIPHAVPRLCGEHQPLGAAPGVGVVPVGHVQPQQASRRQGLMQDAVELQRSWPVKAEA
jgi:hypothetical protein